MRFDDSLAAVMAAEAKLSYERLTLPEAKLSYERLAAVAAGRGTVLGMSS